MPRRAATKRAAAAGSGSTCRVCGLAVRWASELLPDGRIVRRPLDTVPTIVGRRFRTVDERGTTWAAACQDAAQRGYPDHRDVCTKTVDEPIRTRRDLD